MSRTKQKTGFSSDSFICLNCGHGVPPVESGGHQRNHCPRCLYSRHVDLKKGDRRNGCRGLMPAIGLWIKENGEGVLLHRCETCGFIRANRIAADDDEWKILALAAKPLTALPFPLGMLEKKGYSV